MRLVPAMAVTAVVSLTLAGCGLFDTDGDADQKETTPAAPPSVDLEAKKAPDDLTLGVVMSLSSPPGEGSEWSLAAEGSQVAAYRYGRSDVDVKLQAIDDRGTAKGAASAVRRLADQGVAGIVMATTGAHLADALDEAADAGVPVLLPYADDAGGLSDLAWVTGAVRADTGAALAGWLDGRGLNRTAMIDAGSERPDSVASVLDLRFRAGANAQRVAKRFAKQFTENSVDSVVIAGPAALQAIVLQALQGAGVSLPVLLTPDALSPAFPEAVVRAEGSLAGELVSAGLDVGDPAALDAGEAGTALSAYFAALRAATGDDLTTFFGEQSFDKVAPFADVRSHDAVVALVAAATEAGSAAPGDVAAALAGLQLGPEDGLAGSPLDFSSPYAVASESVTALQATTQDPGVRPRTPQADEDPERLYWFAAPQDQ